MKGRKNVKKCFRKNAKTKKLSERESLKRRKRLLKRHRGKDWLR